jgi:hypothetical protein
MAALALGSMPGNPAKKKPMVVRFTAQSINSSLDYGGNQRWG